MRGWSLSGLEGGQSGLQVTVSHYKCLGQGKTRQILTKYDVVCIQDFYSLGGDRLHLNFYL